MMIMIRMIDIISYVNKSENQQKNGKKIMIFGLFFGFWLDEKFSGYLPRKSAKSSRKSAKLAILKW